jgi:hypothetical protein
MSQKPPDTGATLVLIHALLSCLDEMGHKRSAGETMAGRSARLRVGAQRARSQTYKESRMNIFAIIGVIVVVVFVLGYFGLR